MRLQEKVFPGSRGHREGTLRASGKGSGEWMQEDQEPGERGQFQVNGREPRTMRSTGGRAGTGEVARSWAPRSHLGV